MGLLTGVQGVLQALGYALRPLIISLLRLVVLVLPLVWLFCLSSNASMLVWIAFPIAELITALISVIYELSGKPSILAISNFEISDEDFTLNV